MNGWVIVYRPGGDIYQMIESSVAPERKSKIKKGLNILAACVQMYFWFKS